MEIKVYKVDASRTFGVFLLGLLIFGAGSTFGFVTYMKVGFAEYDQYISTALLCIIGIAIVYKAVFRRNVMIADTVGITFSYLGNHKIPWSEIDTMELVTLNHLSPALNSPSNPSFIFTFIAVFLKPSSTYKLPRQRYWRMRKHPAVKILGREADAYIPTYKINSYGPKFELQEPMFDQRNINRIEAENSVNEILKELEALRVRYPNTKA